MNDLLYVTASLAIVGAVCAMLLIRGKDFHRPPGTDSAEAPGAPDRGATEPVR